MKHAGNSKLPHEIRPLLPKLFKYASEDSVFNPIVIILRLARALGNENIL
jgi:hypothetical protein